VALVTTDILKEYLPEISGTGADTELSNLLDRVEAAIARFLGYPAPDSSNTPTLAVSTYTFFIDSYWYTDISVLQVPVKPIVSITSVHADPDRAYSADTEINADEYEIDKQQGLLIIKPDTSTVGFTNAYRGNKVVGTFGFTLFHKDLVHAVCVFASHLYRAKSSQGKKSQSVRNATTTYSPNVMPDEVRQILYPYRASQLII
jgi:hypothetical protein|tara:strand:+ start:48 stop:656 length:609 start_codon:yes stop_codon:yes gene_type:complete